MDAFGGKTAIVTGGASGIGRAVAGALVARGCRTVIADRDGEGAAAAARELGSLATAVALDVTDAAAVRRLVEETAAAYDRLDYLFNNAGIAVLGEARDTTLDDWNRLIDVNLRGVVNGVVAAYPLMIQQGSGHIVNTASAAGIAPAPGATAYAATKFGVVGLSVSLREEARGFGVRVSAVCPGFIDTPLKERAKLLNVADREKLLREFPMRLMPAERCARTILRGVERNRAIIVVTGPAHFMWRLYRFAPRLAAWLLRRGAEWSPILSRRR